VYADGGLRAVLYNGELAVLSAEDVATFVAPTGGGPPRTARYVPGPAEAWDEGTSTVRLQFEAAGAQGVSDGPALPSGARGTVNFGRKRHGTLVVPHEAVLEFADGPYVLVASSDGKSFSKRRVELGKIQYGMAAVVSGLRLHERIAIKNAFFLDAERRVWADETSHRGASL